MSYRILSGGAVRRVSDGAYIPADEGNADYLAYLAWVAGGGQVQLEAIEARRARAWAVIQAERDRRSQLGGFSAADKWFHSDTFSRTQHLGLMMLGGNIPPGIQWKTMDGSFVEMTQQLAGAVFAAAVAGDAALFAAAEAHRLAMLEAADPDAYDCSSGWPPAFGD
jgi:hypothetical protein